MHIIFIKFFVKLFYLNYLNNIFHSLFQLIYHYSHITSSHYLFFKDINNYTNLNYNQENYKTLHHGKDYKPLLVSDCNLMEELNEDDINFLNEDGNIKLYNIEFDNNTIFSVNNINVNSL